MASEERTPAGRQLRTWLTSACLLGLISTSSCNAVVDTKGRETCSDSSECSARYGEPSACVESACVRLLTPQCTEVWPNDALTKKNVILIGFVGALEGGFASYGGPTKEGAELALTQIEVLSNGLPAAPDGGGQRQLAMLVCDHGSDVSAVARHLVDNVHVPMIIGDSFSTPTLTMFDEVARPAGVLVLSPSATSPGLTTHEDDGLLWRTSPSDVVQVELLKYLVVDVDKVLRDSGVVSEDQRTKIAMPTKKDSAGIGLANAAAKLSDDAAIPAPVVDVGFPYQYENPDEQPGNPIDWPLHISKILEYGPHIVLAMGTGEFVTSMLQGIEDGWDAKNPNLPRPWYLMPEGDKVSELGVLVGKNRSYGLNERIVGTAPGARRSRLFDSFSTAFQGTFDQREPGNLAEFGYDAAYLAAYAIAISRKANPTGRELAEAMKHMSCHDKPPVPVGPTGFSGHFRDAATDGCIDFDGASGPLDFNPDTGEALSDIGMWCVRRNPDGSYGFEPPLDSYYSVNDSAVAVDPGKAPLDLSKAGWCAPKK